MAVTGFVIILLALGAALLTLRFIAGDDEVSVVPPSMTPTSGVSGLPGTTADPSGPDGPLPPTETPVPPESAPEVRYVNGEARGSGDGSSEEDAAALSSIGSIITDATEPTEIRILAADGTLEVGDTVTIGDRPDGAPPVVVRGWSDGSARVRLVGDRTSPYDVVGEPGTDLFRLGAGADRLRFEGFDITDVGTVFRVAGDLADLEITDITADNVRRFFDTTAGGGGETASVTGLRISDVEVNGFSKNVIRIRYDSSAIVIENVIGDSERQDGDNFAIGVQLDGTAHDIVLRRVTMRNSTDSTGQYWNGDGFSAERGVHRVQFVETVAEGNTDGGYDLKGSDIVMQSVRATDNKRNYRFWGEIVVQDCEAVNPLRRGGTGTQAQVQIAEGADVVMRGCSFTDADDDTIVFDLDGPDASLVVEDSEVVRDEEAALSTVEPGNQLVTEDVVETTAA